MIPSPKGLNGFDVESKDIGAVRVAQTLKTGHKTNDTDYDVVAEAEAILRDADALAAV